MKQKYLTTIEAAARLGVTRQFVARLCTEGKLAGERFGRDWFIPESALRKYRPAPVGRPPATILENPQN